MHSFSVPNQPLKDTFWSDPASGPGPIRTYWGGVHSHFRLARVCQSARPRPWFVGGTHRGSTRWEWSFCVPFNHGLFDQPWDRAQPSFLEGCSFSFSFGFWSAAFLGSVRNCCESWTPFCWHLKKPKARLPAYADPDLLIPVFAGFGFEGVVFVVEHHIGMSAVRMNPKFSLYVCSNQGAN